MPNLKNKLSDPDHQPGFYYLAFVQGKFLNDKVNNERTDFSIPKDTTPPERAKTGNGLIDAAPELFTDEISLKAIREGALANISEALKPFLDEINTQKEVTLTAYITEEGPQYRVLMKYQGEFIDDIPPRPAKPTWKWRFIGNSINANPD